MWNVKRNKFKFIHRSSVIWVLLLLVLSNNLFINTATATDFPPFVFIGDFGSNDTGEQGTPTSEADVATMATTLANTLDRNNSIVITGGDNNYGDSRSCADADNLIGDFYREFVPEDVMNVCNGLMPTTSPYNQPNNCDNDSDAYNPSCDACQVDNLSDIRFFPVPGNHDTDGNTDQNGMTGYLSYFYWARQQCAYTPCDTNAIIEQVAPDLDGLFSCDDISTPAYYDVLKTDGHFFFLDSNCNGEDSDHKCKNTALDCKNPDFYSNASRCEKTYCGQQLWLEYAAANSPASYKIVSFHHPPYTTGKYPSCQGMQADYAGMGMTTVLSGHTHYLERLNSETESGQAFIYYSNGGGGAALDEACNTNYPVAAKPGTGTLINAYDYDTNCGSSSAFSFIFGQKIDLKSDAVVRLQSISAADPAPIVFDTCDFSPNGDINCELPSEDIIPDTCEINEDGTVTRINSGQCNAN